MVQLLRENNARQRYFTEDEIRRIFLSADDDTSTVAACYVKLLLLTGLRRDELRLAKWEHVDPVKRTLWLPETKNGYGRIVHLNSLAMDVIRTLPTQRGNPWLFIGKTRNAAEQSGQSLSAYRATGGNFRQRSVYSYLPPFGCGAHRFPWWNAV